MSPNPAHQETAAPPPRRRKLRWMLLVRRVHMYAGLALLPWLLVYGFSALLFNHPTWLSDRELRSIGAEAFRGTAFDEIAPVDELAERVLAAVGAELEKGPPSFEFDAPLGKSSAPALEAPAPPTLGAIEGAHLRGDVVIDINRKGSRDRLFIDPSGPAALDYTTFAQPRSAADKAPDPFKDARSLELDFIDTEGLLADMPHVIESADIADGEASVRGLPDLRFDFRADGELWHGEYDLGRQRFQAERADEAFDESAARSLFARLHKTHQYAATFDSTWLWSAFVDALGMLLIFWSSSGLLMWWQLRRARKAGLVLLAVTLAIAIPLVLAIAAR